jgi:DNA-binding ferritin-like protein
MSKEMRKYIDTFKGRMLKENVEVNQQKSIQHIINNEIVDRFDTGNVSITTAIEAVKIAYQEIIDMIELNFETAGELGGGITEAQSIINRIEEFKKRAKENF